MRPSSILVLIGAGSLAAHVASCSPVSSVEDRTCGPPQLDAPLERKETADGEFFSVITDPVLTDSQALSINRIAGRLGVIAVTVARVPDSAAAMLQEGRYLGIRLSHTARTIGLIRSARDVAGYSGDFRRGSGFIAGESAASHFSLSVFDVGVLGFVWREGFFYQIEPIGGGLHAISEASACEVMLPD